jgi:ADP-heptose:LPS heptosyltransferase
MKILVYRLGSLGDSIVALPALKLIRNKFPNANITILTNLPTEEKAAPIEAVLGGANLFNKVFYYPHKLRSIFGLYKLHSQIRREKFYYFFYLSSRKSLMAIIRDYLFFKTCKVNNLIGFPSNKKDRLPLKEGNGLYRHEIKRLLNDIREIGEIELVDNSLLDINLSIEEENFSKKLITANEIFSKFIVISPGTKQQAKDWGYYNWQKFIFLLNNYASKYDIIFIGSGDEFERCEKLANIYKGKYLNLCGKIGPRISYAVIKVSILFVGHDSGPMHLAAAANINVIAIFSSHNLPGVWYPWGDNHKVFYSYVNCMGCYLSECYKEGKKCILSIEPDEVFKIVKEKLDKHLLK